ncbi:hypothetical protein ARNL5_00963 [Anaerolineae bacterium]|nr:hypothetical protein ARNL5_00963 [Anaerolineae bacterium]
MSRTSLLITSLAAAVALVLLGGLVSSLTLPSAEPAVAPDPSPSPEASAARPPPDVAALEARERVYRERLAEANRRLREQQTALDEARRRLDAPPAPAAVEDRAHGGERDDEHREEHHGEHGDDEEDEGDAHRLAWAAHEHDRDED